MQMSKYLGKDIRIVKSTGEIHIGHCTSHSKEGIIAIREKTEIKGTTKTTRHNEIDISEITISKK